MECRPGCAACCIAISVTSPIPGPKGEPGMPRGKPAGLRCVNLDAADRCAIHGAPGYPDFCAGLKASREMCGSSREEAFRYLAELEALTAPGKPEAALPSDTRPVRARI